MNLFEVTHPTIEPVPIIISVPHAGTKIPGQIKKRYNRRIRRYMDDTDWFVNRLYDFAPDLGITIIKANLSRWVIDLNRDPESIPLYGDSRLITGLTPLTDFFGNSLYKNKDLEPDQIEITQRLAEYYWPYYEKIEELIDVRKEQFGKVLLWDAHSIRHQVSTIQKDSFPDMILGNNEEKTAHPKIIEAALSSLKSASFQVNHNSPFKGGHITRYFGKPENNVHALQLEMNKILYMDDNELTFNESRADIVRALFQKTMLNLIEAINRL